jgi:hypothetical protein
MNFYKNATQKVLLWKGTSLVQNASFDVQILKIGRAVHAGRCTNEKIRKIKEEVFAFQPFAERIPLSIAINFCVVGFLPNVHLCQI